MKHFEINVGINFAIDTRGISVINMKYNSKLFIQYPEAVVWAILIEEYEVLKSIRMLQAILCKNEIDTEQFINDCLSKWKVLSIIL